MNVNETLKSIHVYRVLHVETDNISIVAISEYNENCIDFIFKMPCIQTLNSVAGSFKVYLILFVHIFIIDFPNVYFK